MRSHAAASICARPSSPLAPPAAHAPAPPRRPQRLRGASTHPHPLLPTRRQRKFRKNLLEHVRRATLTERDKAAPVSAAAAAAASDPSSSSSSSSSSSAAASSVVSLFLSDAAANAGGGGAESGERVVTLDVGPGPRRPFPAAPRSRARADDTP